MKWLANIHDPTAGPVPLVGYGRLPGESAADAFRRRLSWLRGKHIGPPFPAHGLDAETLARLGLVGVYELEPGDQLPAFDDQLLTA